MCLCGGSGSRERASEIDLLGSLKGATNGPRSAPLPGPRTHGTHVTCPPAKDFLIVSHLALDDHRSTRRKNRCALCGSSISSRRSLTSLVASEKLHLMIHHRERNFSAHELNEHDVLLMCDGLMKISQAPTSCTIRYANLVT